MKLDQRFGLAPLLAGRVARLDRGNRERAGTATPSEAAATIASLPVTASLLALDELVEADAEHPATAA